MGMTQRDVMGREVGGGFMFWNARTPVVDLCQCMAKPIHYCKVKKKKKKSGIICISEVFDISPGNLEDTILKKLFRWPNLNYISLALLFSII